MYACASACLGTTTTEAGGIECGAEGFIQMPSCQRVPVPRAQGFRA